MSTIHAFDVPEVMWFDWGLIVAGLGIGVGVVFEIINLSCPKARKDKVFTPTNFWLILSGVIHVSFVSALFRHFSFYQSNSTPAQRSTHFFCSFFVVLSWIWIEFNMVFFRSNSLIKPTMDMYAAADYRYGDYGGIMESGTAAMEAITALATGPLCFLVVLASVQGWGCHHPFQIMLCTMQLYGLVWFTLQPVFSHEGFSHHFSADPTLFWAIAVGANAPWAIFPTILLIQSLLSVSSAMAKNKSD